MCNRYSKYLLITADQPFHLVQWRALLMKDLKDLAYLESFSLIDKV